MKILWKLRKIVSDIEYWLVAFNFPITLFIFYVTKDYWKALAFWVGCEVYHLGGNLRGLTLHLEGFLEEMLGKEL